MHIYTHVIMNHPGHNNSWNGSVMCLNRVCCLCVSVCCASARDQHMCETGHSTRKCTIALYVIEPRTHKKSFFFFEFISTTTKFEIESAKQFSKRPKSFELIRAHTELAQANVKRTYHTNILQMTKYLPDLGNTKQA